MSIDERLLRDVLDRKSKPVCPRCVTPHGDPCHNIVRQWDEVFCLSCGFGLVEPVRQPWDMVELPLDTSVADPKAFAANNGVKQCRCTAWISERSDRCRSCAQRARLDRNARG